MAFIRGVGPQRFQLFSNTTSILQLQQLVDETHIVPESRNDTMAIASGHSIQYSTGTTPGTACSVQSDEAIRLALLTADIDAEFTVVYQPIFRTDDNSVIGFEALARWISPHLGIVSPADFIPIAENCNAVSKITRVLFRKALATAATWPEHIRLSFNLSVQDISSAEGALRLIAQILESGIDPKRIDFEITETAIMHQFEKACRSISTFKALGVGISLDDFGTGYSSLSRLHELPWTKLKIDRAFIRNLEDDRISQQIVKSLITLCSDMDLECIVEGIETESQYSLLKQMGCASAQGFYLGCPQPASAIDEMLNIRPAAKRLGKSA